MARLYDGLSNKEIAELLGNSVRTIELRRATIYSKMGVKSSIELARLLQSSDWQPPPFVAGKSADDAETEKAGKPAKAAKALGVSEAD